MHISSLFASFFTNYRGIVMNKNKKELGKFLLKKKIYIILITMIFAITGIGYALTNVQYMASQKILVGNDEAHLMDTYQELIKGSTVLEEVVQNLGLSISVPQLAHLIEVSAVENTNMIELKVQGEEEQQTQNISSEIAKVFMATVERIYGTTGLYCVDNVAKYYTTGNALIVGVSAAVVGFLLSSLFFIIAFLMDTKIKSCKEMEEITGLKSLISIPKIKMIEKKKLNIKNIRAHKSEVFKLLMTNIQFVNANHLQSESILVTSAHSLVGKTYVATNLAIEFAKVGKKVILIDGDMRKGRISKIFNLPNDLGFSNYLSSLDSNGNHINERITQFINDTEIKNLNVITAGNMPPNPSELLATGKIDELMKELKIFYDIIIFDTVSVLEAPEAEQLAKKCDLTLMVSAYGKTKQEDLLLAYTQINQNSTTSIGVGLNQIPDTKLKKEWFVLKNNFKRKVKEFFKRAKVFFRKSKKFLNRFSVVAEILKKIGMGMVVGFVIIQKGLIHFMHQLRSKMQELREKVQTYKKKKEAIKLIESGGTLAEEKNNVVREVFEKEIAKLERDEVEYRKKLDSLKSNLETKNVEMLKVRPVVTKTEPQEKSKFDLIREKQQKEAEEKAEIKEDSEDIKEEEPVQPEVIKIEENKEETPKRQSQEARKAEEKRIRQEKIDAYEEIDLSQEERITEEMIRRQVEMDDMIRLAEQEEAEEALKLQRMKKDEKLKRKQERKEKFQNWFQSLKNNTTNPNLEELEEQRIRKMENKIEEKIRRETEKSENRARLEKEREEKKVSREMEKQRQKEELRIQEELQEDNLYPKPKI